MEENLQYLLFKMIYDDLKLFNYEKKIVSAEIKPKTIVCEDRKKIISQYFFLESQINLQKLTLEKRKQLNKFYNDAIHENDLLENKKLKQFLKNNMMLMLTNQEKGYIKYNGFEIPKDAVILSFQYCDYDENYTTDQVDFIFNMLNEIQLNPFNPYKIAFIRKTETLKERRII